jgi:hypothetical protein
MKPANFNEVIGGKRYNTETAEVIASNAYWDGHNWERSGRNTYLYRTKKGGYFATHLTCWQGERDTLEPLSQDEAVSMYESLQEHEIDFEDAFPGVAVEEA